MAKRALGKGLSALIGDSITPGPAETEPSGRLLLGDREAVMVSLDRVDASPHQPRKIIGESALEELAASIRTHGILQPVLVRDGGNARYELVAGERRVRAARLAGLDEIPALVCTLEETEAMRVALLENIQREDLNAIEEAEAYQRIMEAYGATHGELADMLGKKRSTVSNMLRLLGLPEDLKNLVIQGALSMGHARALLAFDDTEEQVRVGRAAAREGLSVREVEKKARITTGPDPTEPNKKRKSTTPRDPDARVLREFENRLQIHLGAPVVIRRRGKRGRIEVAFFSDQELEGLLEAMGVSAQI